MTPGHWPWLALAKRMGAQSPRPEAEPAELGTHSRGLKRRHSGGGGVSWRRRGQGLWNESSRNVIPQYTKGTLEMTGVCVFDFFLSLGKTPPQARKAQPWVIET